MTLLGERLDLGVFGGFEGGGGEAGDGGGMVRGRGTGVCENAAVGFWCERESGKSQHGLPAAAWERAYLVFGKFPKLGFEVASACYG